MEHEHKPEHSEHKHHTGTHEHKHHSEHAKKHVKLKKTNIWMGISALLAIALIISFYTGSSDTSESVSGGELGKEQTSEKALDYINTYLLGGGATAEIKGVKEENGMHVITLEIQGQEFDSYITKDGKLLFPQAIDLDEKPEVPETQESPSSVDFPKTDKPNVKMFVMTFCPYGQQAEDGLKPAIELLNEDIEFEPHFVIYSNYASGYPDYCLDEDSKYCSMHGISELNEGVRQLCIWKYDKEKFWTYVDGINSKCSNSNIETCWEGIAEETNVDVDKIKTCQEEEALTLLEKEAELNKKYGIRGSPDIKINEQGYSGARTPEAFKTAICSAFTTAPDSCEEALSITGAAASGSC